MAAPERDGAAVRIPPPLVYLSAVIAGGVLQLVAPFRLGLPPGLRIGSAVAAALLGLALGGSAFAGFRRTGQSPKPWESTPEILATGSFRFTRNPMYVAMALFQLAIGLGWGNGWIVAGIPVVLVVVQATAIRHEEAYLERKFGDDYRRYKATTRRWL